ncbi:hypothetical protein AVEN_31788-1 [Araneus ventricosus]|uniref:Uncharacterized protein n=1 Tax=Araneus ventricosus TaxID=182803 RepID=A0A4Y2SL24_ARAVE|nr:hypothetical protein AVEN_31788-1 [Araneus ventricosus]
MQEKCSERRYDLHCSWFDRLKHAHGYVARADLLIHFLSYEGQLHHLWEWYILGMHFIILCVLFLCTLMNLRPRWPSGKGFKFETPIPQRKIIRGLTQQFDQEPHSLTERTSHFDTRRFKRNTKVAAMFVVFDVDLHKNRWRTVYVKCNVKKVAIRVYGSDTSDSSYLWPIPLKIRRVLGLLHVKSYVRVRRPLAGVVRKPGEAWLCEVSSSSSDVKIKKVRSQNSPFVASKRDVKLN